MTRVLHLLPRGADLQTRQSVRALTEACDGGSLEMVHTVSPAGEQVNRLWTAMRVRRIARDFDVLHAWDEPAFAVATLVGGRRIIFTAPPVVSRPTIERLCRCARDGEI